MACEICCGIEVAGEDDLGFGTDGAYPAQQLQPVETIASLAPATTRSIGPSRSSLERFPAARHVLDLAVVPLQNSGQVFLNRGVGIDQQQAARAQNISTL